MLKSRIIQGCAVAGLFGLFCVLAPAAHTQDAPGGGRQGWWWNMWKDNPSAPWELKNMSPEQRQRLARYSAFMNKDVPQVYLDATNDVGFTTEAILAGGNLYAANCAKCHGDTGLGNGEMAANLAPSPALLAYLMDQPIAIDPYLLWTISEGGVPFGTKMPAFKDSLSKEQIWQIVAYLRAGFPVVESGSRTGESSPPVENEAGPTFQAKPDGKVILKNQCGRCHSIEAIGESPLKYAPPLREIYLKYPIEQLEEGLAEGMGSRHRNMPQIQFSTEEISAILNYLGSITGVDPTKRARAAVPDETEPP